MGQRAALLACLVGGALLLAACGGEKEAAPVEPGPTAAETVLAETGAVEAAGKKLYLAAGCGGCHGENAQGTEIAPALPGHTEEAVRRQVRGPLGQMPSYSESQLSEKDLEMIIEYITGLERPAEAVHVEAVGPGVVASHHWMAIIDIKSDDVDDALHHVRHIFERVKGEHREAMREAERLLLAEDLHEAEHLIEDMLAGQAKPELSLQQLHLQTALSALTVEDVKDAQHHIEHFLESATGEEAQEARAILAALRAEDLHRAEDGIRALLELGHED